MNTAATSSSSRPARNSHNYDNAISIMDDAIAVVEDTCNIGNVNNNNGRRRNRSMNRRRNNNKYDQ